MSQAVINSLLIDELDLLLTIGYCFKLEWATIITLLIIGTIIFKFPCLKVDTVRLVRKEAIINSKQDEMYLVKNSND